MTQYNFCPQCSNGLTPVTDNGQQFPGCLNCNFIHYNNPIPVAAAIVPVENKIVLVQRAADPKKGGWCLPCGFINAYEDPKEAAIREVQEESGLICKLEKILYTGTPLPRTRNQMITLFLARPVDGILRAGDDALDAKLFAKSELPPICFSSHDYTVKKWFAGDYGILTGVDLE